MSFGRKGLEPGAAAPAAARQALGRNPAGLNAAPRRAAFAAPEPVVVGAASGTAAADPLAALRNGARPATRLADDVGKTWNPVSDDALRAARGGGGQPVPSSKGFIWGHPSGRNLFVAYLLWFVLAQVSMHRFYCGRTASAWQQIGLFVGSLIVVLIFPPLGAIGLLVWLLWIIADLFLIPGMLGRFKEEHATPYYLDFL